MHQPLVLHNLFAMPQVVEKHGNEFKESDVVTTFLTIADWDHTTGNHEVLQSKPFQTLVGTKLYSQYAAPHTSTMAVSVL